MRQTIWWLLLAAPNLLALDITTLDGTTYRDCHVSKAYPDSLCILYSGGGARVKFTNLPQPLRTEFSYDSERATAFEQAEAARAQQERAFVEAQRQQLQSQRNPSASPPNQPSPAPGVNNGAEYARVALAAAPNGASGLANTTLNQFGGGVRGAGAQYVAIRI